jgi:hypothetical protein
MDLFRFNARYEIFPEDSIAAEAKGQIADRFTFLRNLIVFLKAEAVL